MIIVCSVRVFKKEKYGQYLASLRLIDNAFCRVCFIMNLHTKWNRRIKNGAYQNGVRKGGALVNSFLRSYDLLFRVCVLLFSLNCIDFVLWCAVVDLHVYMNFNSFNNFVVAYKIRTVIFFVISILNFNFFI